MRGFLAGVGAATVLFALTSFAYWSGRMEAAAAAPPAVARTGGVVLRDLPLYRGFQAVVPMTSVFTGSEMLTTFPSNLGAAVTQVSVPAIATTFTVDLKVDGVTVARRLGNSYNTDTTDFVFDPPLVVPPGHLFGIQIFGGSAGASASIGGWVLFPGDV